MKKCLAVLLCLCVILLCAACGSAKKDKQSGDKLQVVCSIFPQYDFTRRIAGEHARVTQLLPAGMDSHEYEPSVKDVLRVNEADLFIYTDDELENWIVKLKSSFTDVKLVRCADGIDLEALNEQWEAVGHHDEEEHSEHGHEHAYDAHIWMDLTLAIRMCENIRDALIAADPKNKDEYTANCAVLTQELLGLDAEFTTLFEENPDAVLYFGGKFAYSHFIRHYGIDYLSAYDSCSDEGEPGARVIVEMVNSVREHKAAVIFTDEMSSGEVARAIAEEAGCRVLVFHSCHNVSSKDAGLSFTDLMRQNYANIREALKAQGEV